MEFFKKALPLIIVAVIFAVGGYFIGRGALHSQGAALYKATSTLTPCDYSPTNPCPTGSALKVNNTCPQGTQFINGRCVSYLTYADASQVGIKTTFDFAAWCAKVGGKIAQDPLYGTVCKFGTISAGSSTTKTQ